MAMTLTYQNRILDITANPNSLLIIGDEFDINDLRVYQLDWWGIIENERTSILNCIQELCEIDIDINAWHDVRLIRDYKTGLFTLIVSDIKLDETNIEAALKEKWYPIWEIDEF